MQEPNVNKNASWKELFFKEAFFLYEHREAIYSDERMFCTPLPFDNNLAYSGNYGLDNATLGVYLEWWDSCERVVLKERDEVVELTYFIAGSPLSGINTCAVVDRDGKPRRHSFIEKHFSEIWRSFEEINSRYEVEKQSHPAFTLEETIAKVRA